MAYENWITRPVSVVSLHLDPKNPRLGRETSSRAPREIIQYLFENDKAYEVAESIALRGYFPNEPLLAVNENEKLIVIEGNRRLSALKALREPGLLEGSVSRRVERLSRRISDLQLISKVPVTIAPNRRATDRLIVGRHIGTAVLSWEAENRASFILDKLGEGYDNVELEENLGFSLPDIQKARQTRAIADMARSINLPDEIKAKLDNPRAKIFTTLGRVFDSSVGREYLKIEPDSDHGLQGKTTKLEFVRGFTKLVNDIALGKETSRSLNTNDDIRRYFESWNITELPADKQGTFIPSDIIQGRSLSSTGRKPETKSLIKSKQISKTVLPSDFKVRFGNERLIDIRRELTRLKREIYPNAGAVLLRVFFELSAEYYLERIGELSVIKKRLEEKGQLRHGTPTLKQLVPELIRIVKANFPPQIAARIEKAIQYNDAAPFTISDLHSFVHQPDLPSDRDILQFWLRTEPLFRMMLESEPESLQK